MRDVMPGTVKVHDFLRPQGTQHGYLFGATPTARMEVLPQGFILDDIPAHANAKPHTALAEHIDLSGLLGHQGGLPLRQN